MTAVALSTAVALLLGAPAIGVPVEGSTGVLFLALSLSPLRQRLNDALPMPFKFALSAGLGLLLTLSGLLSLVVSEHFDVLGTLQGVASDTKLADTTGDVVGQKEAFVCCGAATCAGAMLGVVSYVVVMVCRKRADLVDPALYLLAAVFVLNAVLGVLS